MRIDGVILKYYRGFKDTEIYFNGKSTILYGINGAGKTSVLDAINILYARIIDKIALNQFKQTDSLNKTDIKFGENITTLMLVGHIGESGLSRHEYTYSRSMERRTGKRTHDAKNLETIANIFWETYITPGIDMPIFANYGAHRAVHVVPVKRIRTKHEFNMMSAFDKAIVNVIDFRLFFEWFRERQEYESSVKAYEDSKYVDIALKSVKKAILMMLDQDGFSDVRIMFNPLRMVAKKGRENLMIEQLSDGEKCTLAMIGDLARRLSLANPNSKNPLLGSGVVLIDEIELHLHPTWQARILGTLIKIFPNIQFIVTTHSPKVLSEFNEGINVFELSNDNGEIVIENVSPLYGWSAGDILQNFMGTSQYDAGIDKQIDQIFSFIQKKDYDKAEHLLKEFEAFTSPHHPEVARARILLTKGKRESAKN